MRDLIADDVLYTPMPLFWVGGFSFTLIAAMHAGATLVFEEQFEPGATLDLIERERITQVLGWPHMAKALVDHPTFKDHDLSSIRGGSYAALLPQHIQHTAEVPRANSLGMTETLGPHTFDSKDNPLPPEKEGSFGFSVPGRGAQDRRPVTGRGPAGRRERRALAARLLPHARASTRRSGPRSSRPTAGTAPATAATSTRTGTSTSPAGWAISSSRPGMNITPRDVELALEAMPEVVLAFVTGIDAGERGQDVVAAIALSPGETLDEEEARKRVKEEIASYKVPRHIACSRPDRAPVARLGQGRPTQAHRHPRGEVRET
jgi:acyl-coenzyme A synthetase/AMP-(fatty) acid ligase